MDNLSVVESIFLAALDKGTPEERAAYLDQACGGQAELRRHVERLLSAQPKVGSFLEAPAPGLAGTALELPVSERPGTVIGPYKLMEQIGEGGMGLVFVAEQQQPVRRKVALKVIKPGMDTREVIARFEAERQALALMEHPNIAKILDAGATGSGRPYFVMELVKGVPITDYCDQNELTPRERLELFVSVCQAVQHAHTKGVIHRDLKPSNILIAPHDGKPVVKVIDFGVAKAIGGRLTDKTIYTGFAQVVGTSLYMSPEQAGMSGLDIDTRSDIYSLGVLLYELLTGTTPFDQERLRKAAFEEIRRIIREEEPPKPSTRLDTLGATLSAVSAKRKTEPGKLSALVRGDLDCIVMKGLEKDRSRRYETAAGLARDVEHYLRDEEVEACPPTAGYKLRKFARKHQKLLGTAAAFAVLLLLGVAASTWQAVRATQAEAVALANEQQANANAAQAQKKEQEANQQRDEVKALNAKLLATQAELRRTLYAAHMNLAQNASQKGRISRVRELLEPYQPRGKETDLRGFEWRYLHRLYHSELLSLKGHTGSIPADRSIAFSPDGKRLAGGFQDNTVKVWDAHTGHELVTCKGHTRYAIGVAFSPDGKRLASLSWDSTVKIWDAQTGKELLSIKVEGADSRSLAFSPDGMRLASGFGDKAFASANGTVMVWDAQTGEELLTLEGHTGSVWSVAFSPDGQQLASASVDKSVKVWNAKTGKELLTLKHTNHAHSVTFSPDGKRLASGLKVWDAETGKELFSLKEYSVQVNCVAFSPDGNYLAICANDAKVKLWDAQTGLELRTFIHTGLVECVVFSPDGTRLAAASFSGTVKVWDLTSNPDTRIFTGHTSDIDCIAFSPNGKLLATSSATYDETKSAFVATEVKVSDAQTGKELATFKGHSGRVSSLAFSPDGKRVASASMGDKTVKVWDALTGQEVHTLVLNPEEKGKVGFFQGGFTSVAFSPDGKCLASVSAKWVKDKEKRKSKEPFGKEVWPISGRIEATVKVWDAETGKELLPLKGVGPRLVFSPDSTRLANGGAGETKVWEVPTGKEIHSFGTKFKGPGGNYGDVAFSPDGKRLAISSLNFPRYAPPGTAEVKVVDAETREELCTLKGLTGHLKSVVFSLDGKRLATADWWDNTVKLWDAHTGQELLTLTLNKDAGRVNSLAFSPDGNRLASNVMIWDATPVTEKP